MGQSSSCSIFSKSGLSKIAMAHTSLVFPTVKHTRATVQQSMMSLDAEVCATMKSEAIGVSTYRRILGGREAVIEPGMRV